MSDAWRTCVSAPLRGVAAYIVPRPAGDPAIVKLDANESPYPLPADVAAALAAELARVDVNRYPDPACHELRALVAAELGVAPEQLAFGHGSNELVLHLCLAFGQPRPGADRARALYPVPSFVYYRSAAIAAGLAPVEVELGEGFALDEAALAAAIAAERPNLVFFARPNNPTGTLWPRQPIERIIAAHPDAIVVVDEAYVEFGGDDFRDRLATSPNLVLLRTFSKVGMAGLRIGFAVASPAVVAELGKVIPPYNLGVLHQRAAAWLLANHRELLRARARAVAAERERVAAALAALPALTVYPSAANLLLVRVPAPEAAWRALSARGVLVRRFPGHPRLDPYLRVTIGTPAENDRFLAALAEVLPP
jgi:histidinol-phosphate aminotransferase